MTLPQKTLEIRTSPHLTSGASVDKIMFHVALALLPATGFAIWTFGVTALLTIVTAIASCVLTELLTCRWSKRASTLGNWSAVVTGLLYGLTLPPGIALWMVAVGGMIAVGLGKALFGGLGQNPFNPALVGRAVLQAAFPVPMTTWYTGLSSQGFWTVPQSVLAWPMTEPSYDGITGATPLSAWKFDGEMTESTDLLMGFTAGSTGETSAALILLGGLYLAVRNMMNWRIPIAILATVGLFSGVLHLIDAERYASPAFMLFSGGLMLGAVFMATDMVASPMTHRGAVLYGVIIALLVVVIRVWGGMPEGVMYAILLANAIAPHIDGWIQPKVYGTRLGKEASS